MAITPTAYASAQNKTAAGTVTLSATLSVIPVNTLLVLAVTADNVAAATPTISSITNVGGGTWTNRAGAASQSGASTTAGSGVFVYCYTLLTTTTVASGTSIVVTFNASPAAKSALLVGFSEASNTLRNTVVSGVSTVGTPSAATAGTALVAGDLVIGVAGCENNVAFGTDVDTTNGSWVAVSNLSTTGGVANTNVTASLQYKVVTATGAQTFNPPSGALDAVAIVFAMVPATPVAPTARTISAAAGTPAQASVILTWAADTAAIPATTYLIEQSPDGSTGWTTTASGQTGQTGYTATSLVPGKTYYFRVTGSNSAGSSTSNVAGPITTTTASKLSTFSEQFTTYDTGIWQTVTGTPTINAGQLQLVCTLGGGTESRLIAGYDFSESSVVFKAIPPGLTATATRIANIFVHGSASITDSARIQMQVTNTTTTVKLGYRNSSVGPDSSSVTYSPTSHAYLRMSLAGTTLSLDGSPDGSTWTQVVAPLTGVPTALIDKLSYSLIYMECSAGATDATDPQSLLIDSINVTPGVSVALPVPVRRPIPSRGAYINATSY